MTLIFIGGCSANSEQSKEAPQELIAICDLFNKAEDFTKSDEEREEIALKLDTSARLLVQSDSRFNEVKVATLEYYKEFKKVVDAKIAGKTGIIGTVSPEYQSANSFLTSFCELKGSAVTQ